jgi:hypothetical protein
MTVDERFEQLERKTQRLEKRNKRLMVGLTMMAVVVCAVVTMAATNVREASKSKIGRWEFHRDQRQTFMTKHGGLETERRSHYLLDTETGKLWQVGLTKKELVVKGKVN